MEFEVRLFGPAAQAARADRVRVRWSTSDRRPSPRELLAALGEQHPAVGFALGSARLAVNHAFAAESSRVSPEDEVALIALVGGG